MNSFCYVLKYSNALWTQHPAEISNVTKSYLKWTYNGIISKHTSII